MSDEERRNFDISGQESSHNNFERQSFSKYSTDDGEDIAQSRRNGRYYLIKATFLNNRRDRSSRIRLEGRDTSYYCDCESAEEESTHNGSNSRHDGRSYRTDENIRSNWKNLSSRMRLEEPEASYYSNDSAEYASKSTHNGFNSRRKARFNSRNGRRHNVSKIDVIDDETMATSRVLIMFCRDLCSQIMNGQVRFNVQKRNQNIVKVLLKYKIYPKPLSGRK